MQTIKNTPLFPLTEHWIAPFGADVKDTSGSTVTKFKRQTLDSSTPEELANVTAMVNKVYTEIDFTATHVYVITWLDVQWAWGISSEVSRTFYTFF